MNRGLIEKSLREAGATSATVALGLFAVQVLFSRILPMFYKDVADSLFQVEFIRKIVTAFLGAELGSSIGPAAMSAMAWSHPIVLALVWAHAIIICTRVPAGEVDRGTIDILFSLPVTRMEVYIVETTVWLTTAAGVIGLGLIGNVIGGWSTEPQLSGTLGNRAWVSVNLLALSIAVGGMAWLFSSLCDRRGRAIGLTFSVLCASFVLNFLGAFSDAVEPFTILSLLEYYRPIHVLTGQAPPIRDIAFLTAFGSACWAAGAMILVRRNILTV